MKIALLAILLCLFYHTTSKHITHEENLNHESLWDSMGTFDLPKRPFHGEFMN